MADPDEDRLTNLEARLAALESQVHELRAGPPRPNASPVTPTPSTSAWATPPRAPAPASATAPAPASATAPAPQPTSFWDSPARSAQRGTPPTAAEPAPWSLPELDERLAGRLLAWVGGVALFIGAVFFLSIAFSRGWIGPEARVVLALVGAAVALGLGTWLFERRLATPAIVLVAVGVGVGTLGLFAATRLYGLIAPEFGLAASLVLAAGTAAIAIRANSQVVAMLGVVAVVAAPPVLGAPANEITVGFMAAILGAGTAIALARTWPWLPLVGFLLASPQLWSWLDEAATVPVAFGVVAGFWLLHAIAAGGEPMRTGRDRLDSVSATLLVINGLFAVAAIRLVLEDADLARQVALVGLAAAHVGLATPLLLRRGPGRAPFGQLAMGVGVGVLTIAIAVELAAPARPIAWTILASALAWLGLRYRDSLAAAGAALQAMLLVGEIVLVRYPIGRLESDVEATLFLTPGGLVVGLAVAATLGVGVLAARSLAARPVGPGLTPPIAFGASVIGALSLVAWAAPFELPLALAVATWAAAGGILFALGDRFAAESRSATSAVLRAGSVFVALGITVAVAGVAGPDRLVVDAASRTDHLRASLSAVVAHTSLIAVILLATWYGTVPALRLGLRLVVATLAVYLGSVLLVDIFQARVGPGDPITEIATQAQVGLSIGWVLVGAVAFGAGVVRRIGAARAFGLAMFGIATAKVFLVDLAALDVAYRVLSFIGLGVVLLASSVVAARFGVGRSTSPPPT
jgi:uncharacterized membrane protein